MSKLMKITSIFKEKKSQKRSSMKGDKEQDSDEEKFKELDTHAVKNKKIKFLYPKPKKCKPQKTLYDLIHEKDKELSNESKSTQAWSKKLENICEEEKEIDKEKDDSAKKKEKLKKNVFELSAKTKSIINAIYNKKKEEKKNKINNKENDSSLMKIPEEQNSINRNKNKYYNKIISKNNDASPFKKASPPKLSSQTVEIMKQLKQERKNRFDREDNTDKKFRSDSSFSSLKFKYEELLSKPRELRLPIKYKILNNAFISLEQTISLNKIREKNQLNTFDNIRTSVENVTKHKFDMATLKQILYVVPHFYVMKYVKKKRDNIFRMNDSLDKDYDLIIDIPKDSKERINKSYPENFDFLSINYYNVNSGDFSPNSQPLSLQENNIRREIFKNILNRMVNVYHTKYLIKNNIRIKFDPLKEKTWEHGFNPDKECDDIPLFEIPSPPNKISVFQETIMKNDIRNEIMKDALDMVNKSDEKSVSQNLNLNSNNKNNNISSSGNKYVSQKFLDKIRAKEKANNIINEINNYNNYHNSNKDWNNIYREILIQMKTKLLLNKKSMELKNLCESVLNSSKLIKDSVIDVDKLEEIICKLCDKYKEFIPLKKHSSLGKIVVLENTNFEIPKIVGNIDDEN